MSTSLRPVGRNGPVTMWESREGVQLALIDGVLIGTRGLGFDLMIADGGATFAGQIRETPYVRQFRHLDGAFVLGRITMSCRTTSPRFRQLATLSGRIVVRDVVERCRSADRAIENTYAIGPNGRIWQSRQWVSDRVGYLEITLVRP